MATFDIYNANTRQMDMEMAEVRKQLQGRWKRAADGHIIEIVGKEITILSASNFCSVCFELKENLQLKKWQIKAFEPVSWLRTFIVEITEDTFVLYDFDLGINIAMAQRSKLINPSRIYKYVRVLKK